MIIDLIIKDLKILLDGELVDRNILVDEGKIVGISKDARVADRSYEGRGRIAIPGGVDIHVHFRDPSSNEAEDFESGTFAAAHGGITTVVDMPNTTPPVATAEAFLEKRKIAEKKSYIDFGLYGGIGTKSIGNAVELAKAGALGIKTYMASQFPELSSYGTKELRETMLDVSKAGVPFMIHAEDLEAAIGGDSESSVSHALKRPPICESVAIARVLELARQLDIKVHICHLNSRAGLEVLKAFKSLGTSVTAETAPHYLSLTMEEMEKRGPYAKVDPPLRMKGDNEALLSGLKNRDIDLIASDHAPHPKEEKERGWDEMNAAPSGMPGVETTLPFLLDLFHKGRLGLSDIIRVICVSPAELLGLYPKKGALAVGSDADITIVDPDRIFEVRHQNLLTKTHDSIFLGKNFHGSPAATFSRGELIFEGGEVVAKPGRGKFLGTS